MDKIASFTVNHLKLLPGVYVSRRDTAGDARITTFDIRMTRPNHEPVMNTAEIHTIEHLGATFLRNHKVYKGRALYFGPMGCRTGFYLLLAGDYESADIVPLLQEMFSYIRDFEGEIPGAAARDCGNYLDMNLPMARYLARKFCDEVLEDIQEEPPHLSRISHIRPGMLKNRLRAVQSRPFSAPAVFFCLAAPLAPGGGPPPEPPGLFRLNR